MNKEFANRLWGVSFALWIMGLSGNYGELIRWGTVFIFIYFIIFGAERFEKPYKRII